MIRHKLFFALIFTIILTGASSQTNVNQYDENGERHGVWEKTYDNTNQFRYRGQFNHGKEIDTFKYYKLKRGKSVLSATKVFNTENNLAEVTFMASNKKMVSQGKMEGKNFIGKWLFYHRKSEAIMIEENYNTFGQLDQERKVFYDNGVVAESAMYKNGKLNGASKSFSDSNKLLQSALYKDDKLEGQSIYYDADGNTRAQGNYKANVKTGIWLYYKAGVLTRKVDHDLDKVLFNKQ